MRENKVKSCKTKQGHEYPRVHVLFTGVLSALLGTSRLYLTMAWVGASQSLSSQTPLPQPRDHSRKRCSFYRKKTLLPKIFRKLFVPTLQLLLTRQGLFSCFCQTNQSSTDCVDAVIAILPAPFPETDETARLKNTRRQWQTQKATFVIF
jgi:hypothetical protein